MTMLLLNRRPSSSSLTNVKTLNKARKWYKAVILSSSSKSGSDSNSNIEINIIDNNNVTIRERNEKHHHYHFKKNDKHQR
ncbi:hypothetical protein DERP_003997 [Dermatophagoides pteronyssinus]|nr:hypothetical protein DERP_003997 [Dermatophagoides pteronyssinus]